MLDSLYDAVRGLPPALAVLLVAMVPIAELRGAIPLGVLAFDEPAVRTAAVAVVGNLVPVPVILWALEPVSGWLRHRSKLADRFFTGLFAYTRRRHQARFERFEDLALLLFVAVPLPFTGAWGGALAAFVFGIPFRRAFPLIAAGVVVAATVVTALVVSGRSLWGIP